MWLDYRVYFGVSAERLRARLLLSREEITVSPETVGHWATVFSGEQCSAVTFGGISFEAASRSYAEEFGGIALWARYMDDDSWSVDLYENGIHKALFDVNPWEYQDDYKYNRKETEKVRELFLSTLPISRTRIERYFELWRTPVVGSGPRFSKEKSGKAYSSDEFEYGDAFQIFDFLGAFGIDDEKREKGKGSGDMI